MSNSDEQHREVAQLRRQISAIDRELLQTLERRAQASRQIHSLLEGAVPSVDTGEAEWLKALEAESSGALSSANLRAIFTHIRAAARSIEQPVRVAYLAPEGGFGYQLVTDYFGASALLTECATLVEILEEVARGRAVYAALPWESSVEGLFQSSIAALANTGLFVVGAPQVRATFELMTKSGQRDTIKNVYATAAAHAACELFLSRELRHATVTDVRSPRIAAQLAREDATAAAVVPEACGRQAGLSMAQSNVGDVPDLSLRYALAAERPAMRSGRDRTCLLFSVEDSPGSLFEVLRHFAERAINLRQLQSMPTSSQIQGYVFYVEVDGHQTDRAVVTALEEIKRGGRYFKVLGSYPDD